MKFILMPFRYVFIGFSFIFSLILYFIRYVLIGGYYVCTSKIMIVMLVISLFVGVFQVSTGFREEIIRQEQEMNTVNEKIDITYYYDEGTNIFKYNNVGIENLIDCYKNNVDKMPDSVNNYMNELNKLYDSNSGYFSFLYQDLFSGFTVSYNADKPIFTASTIKAPAMIYIYENASNGKIDLSEKLVYTSNYYSGGTGILKNKAYNTSYTVDELIEYTIVYSDNIAYKMLIDKFGKDNINNFWKEKGTKYIFESNSIWGFIDVNDALIYMKELYQFSRDNKEYGEKLLQYFIGAKWKLIADKNGNYNTANKGGWSGSAIHDVAIVFDENPYILIVLSNMGESSYSYLFNETNKLVGNMHYEYWKYKASLCSDVKLY